MTRAKSSRTSGERAAETVEENLKKLESLRKDTARLSLAFLKAYESLWSTPTIRRDPTSRALMLRIARARKIGQLEALVGSLSLRVDELLGVPPRRRGPAVAAPKFRRLDVVAPERPESSEEAPRRMLMVL